MRRMMTSVKISSLIPVPLGLRPRYVTGIQQRRVCGAKESFRPEDSGRLDPCDKHRDEGREQRSVKP
ncbi:hypothetical protein SAMN03159496_00957 [Rhizobium sp. NFR07]|nr:hypothetical protein SAMN03159496_00957 [Rhizobium sp. NFR07]